MSKPKTIKYNRPIPVERKADGFSVPSNELTPKQKLFVNEYLIDLNATAAYKRAGYKGQGRSAENAASRLLGNVGVAKSIQEAINKRSEDLGIDARYVLSTIKETVERCSQAEQVKEKDGTVSGEYRFDAGAVLKGAELLGRHLKMFTDKVEHSANEELLAALTMDKIAANPNSRLKIK